VTPEPRRAKTYVGRGLPYTDIEDLPGTLVVVEGPDGVGRTTQLALLRSWLEVQGFGVVETGWTRSQLVGATIDLAKAGHAMTDLTFNLLYATDFADRVEHEIIPALRSGFVVLADRYIYTAFARAAARRVDAAWVRSLYGFAIEPDIVLYLRADVRTLLGRVLRSSGLDYWEAGMDQNPGCDPYESFRRYQTRVTREFNRLAREFGFRTINARRPVDSVQRSLRRHVAELLGLDTAARRPQTGTPRGTTAAPSHTGHSPTTLAEDAS
jgi:dTMP kinase